MQYTIKQWLPVAVSLLSLILSGIALGWNVYRDVVLKARVRASVSVVRMVGAGERASDSPQFIRIGATNHGPGRVRIEMIVGQVAPLWRRLLRRREYFFVLLDFTNPLNPKLPLTLEVGDSASLLLPYDGRSFLNGRGTHVGISDSFGRSHFAPSRQLKTAQQQFARDFPGAVGRRGL